MQVVTQLSLTPESLSFVHHTTLYLSSTLLLTIRGLQILRFEQKITYDNKIMIQKSITFFSVLTSC